MDKYSGEGIEDKRVKFQWGVVSGYFEAGGG